MRLVDLDASFVVDTAEGSRLVSELSDATGVRFLCPYCFRSNGGRDGTHVIICWSRSAGAAETAVPGPGRWKMVGADLRDLSLEADPPSQARSVQLRGGCCWHGYVTNGEVTDA